MLDVKLIGGMRELGYKGIKLVSNLLTTPNGGTFTGGHLPEEVPDFSARLLEQNGTRGWKLAAAGGWQRGRGRLPHGRARCAPPAQAHQRQPSAGS